jgi:hypothetical protein
VPTTLPAPAPDNTPITAGNVACQLLYHPLQCCGPHLCLPLTASCWRRSCSCTSRASATSTKGARSLRPKRLKSSTATTSSSAPALAATAVAAWRGRAAAAVRLALVVSAFASWACGSWSNGGQERSNTQAEEMSQSMLWEGGHHQRCLACWVRTGQTHRRTYLKERHTFSSEAQSQQAQDAPDA